MQKGSEIIARDYGTNCKDCERYRKLGDVCVLEHGKKFLWEFCRDFEPQVVLPDYNDLMKSVRADQALERKKEKEKKEREKRKKLKARAEKEELRKKERRTRLRKRREKIKKKVLKEKEKSSKLKASELKTSGSRLDAKLEPKIKKELSDILSQTTSKPRLTAPKIKKELSDNFSQTTLLPTKRRKAKSDSEKLDGEKGTNLSGPSGIN